MNLDELLVLAESGDSEAQFQVGKYYLQNANEENYDDFYEKAFSFFKKSASQGNFKGLFNLGLCYENGIGVDQDENKALAYYIESANNLDEENPHIQTKIAACYGAQQNYKSAIEWYLKAAKYNDSDAFYALGYMYFYGQGTKQDVDKAIVYLNKGIENPDSIGLLGVIYSDENSKHYDSIKALECFEKSAEFGNPYSMLYAGEAYLNGTGCDVDFEKGVNYLLNAIDIWDDDADGNSYSVYPSEWQMKAHSFLFQLKGSEELFAVLKSIAQKNNRVAQYYFYSYTHDLYDINDLHAQKERIKWLIQSADNGFPNAQYELGTYYETGIGGCEKDTDKAIHYLSAAAEQGHYGAAYYLNSIQNIRK